jgi:hypothetical protein
MNELRERPIICHGIRREIIRNSYKIRSLLFWQTNCTHLMRFDPSQEDCMYARGSDDWRQLAEAARDEPDPIKLRELIEQLNHELKQRAERLYPVASENSD